MNNAPAEFLSLYMPEFAARAIDNITSTKAGEKTMEWILEKVGGQAGKKYASFLHVGKRSGQLDVFMDLLEQYPDSSMKITALTMYMEKLGAGESVSGYEGQLEEIIEVRKRYPDRLLAFLGIDPRWKADGQHILESVMNYFDNKILVDATRPPVYPFIGLKLYPSTGFYAFDEKLKPTFQWAAENRVPIITHCNYLGGIFNNDRNYLLSTLGAYNPYTGKTHPAPKPRHKLQGNLLKQLFNTQKQENNLNYSSYFLEPESYRAMLQWFKDQGSPLKLCFAHFGGSEHMLLQQRGGKRATGDFYGVNANTNWCAQIQQLMTDFDTVYTDISYALTDHGTHNFIFSELRKSYGNRILFGTDYFMTERVAKEKHTYSIFRRKAEAITVTRPGSTSISAWELMAEKNPEEFLKGKYYL